jgi:fermentation-respiration switch protein FrsA (DUF1100 family)
MKNLALLVVLTCVLAVGVMAVEGNVRRPLLRLGGTVLVALVLFAVVLVLFQGHFIFPRTRAPLNTWNPPPQAEECRFRTEDGLTLHAWWHPGRGADAPDDGPVLLWCHGNAGNITHREANLLATAECGMAALLFDYRGYGQSEGRPSESGLYLDADAAYRYLTDERGIEPGRIVVFGRSLGAAVALDLALRQPVAGLIMESAFENVRAMARLQVPLLPVGPLLRCRFDSLARIGGLTVPLLMLHGDRDRIVPMSQGQAVFDAAPEPKSWHTISGAGHNDTYTVGGADYFRTLRRFCLDCVARDAR